MSPSMRDFFSCMKKAGSEADCEYPLDRKAMRSRNATYIIM